MNNSPCVPLAIKTIMIVLFKILTLFHFKAIRSSWLTLNEILIVSIAKGTQCLSITMFLDCRFSLRRDVMEISSHRTGSSNTFLELNDS